MDPAVKNDIEIAARILREEGATEVYVFGSAAHGKMRPDSDIDFAIRGLPPEKFFPTMGKVGRAIAHLFDLVDLDEENPFTDYIVKEGVLQRVA
ncbi:MAG: nucleotidyltransferase domain-containing protein [Armatimonadetes bacterium]|nr:nucleotidyltransferase domain-containing protein [Armatimonadota bacterium]